jgi:hypothetical protein
LNRCGPSTPKTGWRTGEEQLHPAGEDALLAPLFQPAHASQAQGSADRETGQEPTSEAQQPRRFGARAETETGHGAQSHFVIVADMKSASIAGLEDEIFRLGQAHRFSSQAWVLVSEHAINIVRTALVQKLGKLDTIFIVDAAHDKAAWFNFGPEADTRIRKMWSKPADYAGTERRAARR